MSSKSEYLGLSPGLSTVSQAYKETAFNPYMPVGAQIAYTIITGKLFISPEFDFNYLVGGNAQTSSAIDNSITPSGEAFTLTQTLGQKKYQLNGAIDIGKLINHDVALYAGIGMSALLAKSDLSVVDNGINAGNNAGPGEPKTNYWYLGGLLRIGSRYYVGQHNFFSVTLNEYIYPRRKLHDVGGIDTGGTSNLIDRRSALFLTALQVNWSVIF